MDIIPSLIAEQDIQYMPDSLLLAFSRVFDDILASKFNAYISNPQADKSVVGRIVSVIGDSIKSHTFHETVIANGTKDIVSNLSLETLAYAHQDYGLLINTLQWAKENRPYMRATVNPRSRVNYEALEREARGYDNLVMNNQYPVIYDNMYERIKANKKLFYSPNEKEKGTRINVVIRKSQDCDIALLGAKYLQYCKENNLVGWRVSEF